MKAVIVCTVFTACIVSNFPWKEIQQQKIKKKKFQWQKRHFLAKRYSVFPTWATEKIGIKFLWKYEKLVCGGWVLDIEHTHILTYILYTLAFAAGAHVLHGKSRICSYEYCTYFCFTVFLVLFLSRIQLDFFSSVYVHASMSQKTCGSMSRWHVIHYTFDYKKLRLDLELISSFYFYIMYHFVVFSMATESMFVALTLIIFFLIFFHMLSSRCTHGALARYLLC